MSLILDGSLGVTFPASGVGNPASAVVGLTDTQTLTNKTLTSPTITGAVVSSMASSMITSGTVVASTSGTSIDFTSIPSWVKRVTVIFGGVSTNGSSNLQIQIGSGSVTTTGYTGNFGYIYSSNGAQVATITTGFGIQSPSTSGLINGHIVLTLLSSNTWICSGVQSNSVEPYMCSTAGRLALAGALDRVRITTVNGTDTFDAGSINILYE